MAFSAEEVASGLLDDYGLSEGDSNDEGDDIYGYLGEPILSHADLIPDYEPPDASLDETAEYGTISDEQDEVTDQDSASDDGSSDSTGRIANSADISEQDTEHEPDEDETVHSVNIPRSTPSSEEDVMRDVVSRND